MEINEANYVFNQAFEHIMKWEGGYINDRYDRGGETKYGISKRQYPDVDIANLTRDQAKRIYERDYWNEMRLSLLEGTKIMVEMFDFGVNAGPKRAIMAIQRSLKLIDFPVKIDGIIGNKTISAINFATKHYESALLMALKGYEFLHYKNIVLRNPSQRRFIRGWMARI